MRKVKIDPVIFSERGKGKSAESNETFRDGDLHQVCTTQDQSIQHLHRNRQHKKRLLRYDWIPSAEKWPRIAG